MLFVPFHFVFRFSHACAGHFGVSFADLHYRVVCFFVVLLILLSTRFVNDGRRQRWWP